MHSSLGSQQQTWDKGESPPIMYSMNSTCFLLLVSPFAHSYHLFDPLLWPNYFPGSSVILTITLWSSILSLCSLRRWANWVPPPLRNLLKDVQAERDQASIQILVSGAWTYLLSTTLVGRGECYPVQTFPPAPCQRSLPCLAIFLAPVSLEPAVARLCRHQRLDWVGTSLPTVWMNVWFALAHHWVESTLGRTLSGWINTQSILERLHGLVVWHWFWLFGEAPLKASFNHWCAIERPCSHCPTFLGGQLRTKKSCYFCRVSLL